MNRKIRKGLLFASVCIGTLLLGTGSADQAFAEEGTYGENGTYSEEADNTWDEAYEDNWYDDEEDLPIEDANHVIQASGIGDMKWKIYEAEEMYKRDGIVRTVKLAPGKYERRNAGNTRR